MCTEQRNTTISRRYIRKGYSAQKHNTFQTVHKECDLSTEMQQFIDGTSVICTEPETQLLDGIQKCVLSTETQHFIDGTS